jgi:hypothetical protein
MVSRIGSLPRLLLGGAATAAAGGGLAADVVFDDHPIHSVVLGAVVVVAALLRRCAARAGVVVPAVSAALAVQPVLHVTSGLGRPHDAESDPSGLVLHLLVNELPTAGVQIAVPALAMVAVTICAHLLHLAIDAVRTPSALACAPWAPTHVLVSVRVERLGSMLRWCGWALQAALRGPPVVVDQSTP